MYEAYLKAALKRTTCKFLPEEGLYYCNIPDLPGVWSTGQSQEESERELAEVLEGWVDLGLRLGHPIPPLA